MFELEKYVYQILFKYFSKYFFKLKIWDSAGSERFKSLTTSYFRNADAAILVYSITQSESLYELEDWCKEITNHGDMLRILVGNKNDLNEHREISQDLAVNFAMLENIDLAIETSAKNDENINYLFYTVAEKLVNGVEYESFRQEHPYSTSKDMLKYSSTSKSMEKLFQSPRSHSSFYLSRKTTFKKNVFQKFCVII